MGGIHIGGASAPSILTAALGAALFESDCGHRFIGGTSGSYACPVCGRRDGDRHLILVEQLPVQVRGWLEGW